MDWTGRTCYQRERSFRNLTVSHRRGTPNPSKRSPVTLHLQTEESIYSREDLKQLTEVVNGLLEENAAL